MCQGVELADGMARADSAEVVAEWQEEAPRCAHLSHGPRNAKRAAKAEAKAEAKAKRRSQQQQQQPEQGRSEPSSAAASEATRPGASRERAPAEAHAPAAATRRRVLQQSRRWRRAAAIQRVRCTAGLDWGTRSCAAFWGRSACRAMSWGTRIGPLVPGDTSSAEA